ncbi:TPA: DUF551 domain-containing protein [Klebsiella oxytoca]
MNHTLSDSQLEEMIKSAVNSSGPLPPDEKFSQLISALRELQEHRKAAEGYKNLNEMEQRAEQAECLIMCLDDLGVPDTKGSEALSLWGRVKIFAEENSKDRAELQERRKADSEPVAYMRDGIGVSFMHAGNLDAPVKLRWGTWIPLYRHAQQPLVPPELTEDMEMEYFLRDDWKGTFRGGWEACRAAMLKGGNSQVIPGWIPVSERMPEERMSVILWDAEIGEVTSGHYSHKTQTFYHRGDAIENEITHWMVVAAPQEVKGE